MPKKAFGKQKMTLSEFSGTSNEGRRPTAPRGNDGYNDYGRGGRMDRDGPRRSGYDDYSGPSSDNVNDWRGNNGPRGGGDRGGDRFGDRGDRYGDRDTDRGRGGRDDEFGGRSDDREWRGRGGARGGDRGGGGDRDRYDNRGRFGGGDRDRDRFGGDRDRGGGDRYGDRDRGGRFGGGADRYGDMDKDDRFARREDYDDRPAHLRFGRREPQEPKQDRVEPKEDNDRLVADEERLRPEEKKKKEKEEEEEEEDDEEKEPEQTREVVIDSSLMKTKVTTVDELQTDLHKALKNKTSVSMKQLKSSLSKIPIDDNIEELALTFSKMLIEKKTTFKPLASLLTSRDTAKPHAKTLLQKSLTHIKGLKGEEELLSLLKGEEQDVLKTIAGGKSGAALESTLREADLFCLFPKPDLSKDVQDALETGKGPDTALTLIQQHFKAEMSAAELMPVVATYVLSLVFKDKQKPDLKVIKTYAKLLKRCCTSQPKTMASLLFTAQEFWFNSGKDKDVIKPLFETFQEAKIVSPEGFLEWKGDKINKAPGKPQALLKVNTWVSEIQPVVNEEDDEEEDSGDDDEYLQNPNRE